MVSEVSSPSGPAAHYDEKYFEYQVANGRMTGVLNGHMFQSYIRPQDSIVDFGCGGGFLLQALTAGRKLGVEINPNARACAQRIGVESVAGLDEVPDNSADVVISCHALEHTEAPLDIARKVRSKLRPGGLAVFVVPCERYDTKYVRGNPDQHLYTWSPVNLGNLFSCAGFELLSVSRMAHRWPPGVRHLYRWLGAGPTHLACRVYARLAPKLTQVRAVARRPS